VCVWGGVSAAKEYIMCAYLVGEEARGCVVGPVVAPARGDAWRKRDAPLSELRPAEMKTQN
jgi:propanediol dehydratase small subunit